MIKKDEKCNRLKKPINLYKYIYTKNDLISSKKILYYYHVIFKVYSRDNL